MQHSDIVQRLLALGQCRLAQAGQRMNLVYSGRPRLFYMFSGFAKLSYCHTSGEMQTMRFVVKGETFGGLVGSLEDFDLTFLETSSIVILDEAELNRFRERNPEINEWLYERCRSEVKRLYHYSLLTNMNAEQRVMAFLKEFQMQCIRAGRAIDPMNMPMAQYDVAEYLAMTPETLCRRLRKLVKDGSIEMFCRRGFANFKVELKCRKAHGCVDCTEKRCRAANHPALSFYGDQLALTKSL